MICNICLSASPLVCYTPQDLLLNMYVYVAEAILTTFQSNLLQVNWVPGIRHLFHQLGGVPASRQSMEGLLRSGISVCVIPGQTLPELQLLVLRAVLHDVWTQPITCSVKSLIIDGPVLGHNMREVCLNAYLRQESHSHHQIFHLA